MKKRPEKITNYILCKIEIKLLETTQRWSVICRVFLLCISSQGQDLYSHQKLNMYIYWFSSEIGYRRRRRRPTTPDTTPQHNH